MSVIFMDGTSCGDRASKYDSTSITTSVAGRTTNGTALSLSSTSGANVKSFPAQSEAFYAIAVFLTAGAGFELQIRGDAGATQHLTLSLSAGGVLELRRGTNGGTLLASGATALPASIWHQIQVRATIADSGGIVQVRLNGAGTNEIDFTGDTKNAGTNTTMDQIRITKVGATATFQYTDLVILSTAGTVNNTWPGDVTVRTLTPSGNGASSQWVGSDGNSVDNYLLVDELPWSNTDYVGVGTAGQRDTYAMSDLPAGVTDVRAVQVGASLAKSDAGSASVKLVTKSGASEDVSGSLTLSTTFAGQYRILETDPNGAVAWTAAAVNALEVGVESAA